jgi:serine/threonine protein kinase
MKRSASEYFEELMVLCNMYGEKQNEKSGNVTKNDFEMISIIGKGSYGKVSLVKKKDTGQLYALKVLKKSEIVRRN